MAISKLGKCIREIERAAKKAPGKKLLEQLQEDLSLIQNIISQRLGRMIK